MSRRARTFDPSKPQDPLASKPARSGEMTVTMKGTPDDVREKMGLTPSEAKPEEDSPDQEKKVLTALGTEGLQFQVKRILPREWMGRQATVIVYNDDTPMLYQDIVDEVRTQSGGKKYRLTVIDPTSGKSVAAKTFQIDADPILKKDESGNDEEMMRAFEAESEDDAMAAVGKSFERQVKLAEQRVTLEQHQEMLSSLQRKREGKAGPDDGTAAKLDAMHRELERERHTRELERVQQQADQRVRDLEAKLNAKPQNQTSEFAAVIAQMQKAQEASDKRFETLMQQTRDDKANEILRELRAAKNTNGAGGFKEQMELFSVVAKTFGMRVPGSGGDDDDDRPWYERLGVAITDKVLPKILDKFDSMEKEGKKVTKEDFMREIDAYAEQAADDAARKERDKLARERGLPAAKPAAAANPPPPAAAPAKELPPAAPDAMPAPAADQKPAPPAPAPGAQLTVEQEICLNVNGVIMLIQRELLTRRQYYQWNYEGAWEHLPEDTLEKVCTSADCIAMFDALKVPGIDPAGIDELKKKISENPKMVAWLKLGHDELVEWWKEKQLDPTFDPGAEEEEEEPPTE